MGPVCGTLNFGARPADITSNDPTPKAGLKALRARPDSPVSSSLGSITTNGNRGQSVALVWNADMFATSLWATLVPLAALLATSTQQVFTPGPGFDVREATIDGIHQALYTGEVTCREVVSSFL